MYVTGIAPIMAPQSTGHPAALPADTVKSPPATRVTATSEAADTAGARTGAENPKQKPSDRKDQESRSAPPTLLQLKISSMLEEQVSAPPLAPTEEAPEQPEEIEADAPDTTTQSAPVAEESESDFMAKTTVTTATEEAYEKASSDMAGLQHSTSEARY